MKILKFFDKLEDKIRANLSRHSWLYAFIGSIGIVLLWRGIWLISDDLGLNGWASAVAGIVILSSIGLFVSFFVGSEIIIGGIKAEKRIDEKTEEEIEKETVSLREIRKEIREIKETLKEFRRV